MAVTVAGVLKDILHSIEMITHYQIAETSRRFGLESVQMVITNNGQQRIGLFTVYLCLETPKFTRMGLTYRDS